MRLTLRSLFFMLLQFCIAICSSNVSAQNNDCPPNIGFEKGDFTGWECYTGTVNGTNTNFNLTSTQPVPGKYTIIDNTAGQTDLYGNFDILPPNGSNHCIMLGNSELNRSMPRAGFAERVVYTFKVPDNAVTYSITYYYAVVFQNPPHNYEQQPQFAAKVFNAETGGELACGTASFTASAGLPGFELSPLSPSNGSIFYKPWSPVTIDLSGNAGKTLRLEFTTNHCVPSGHFGYAYIDVDENCASPVTGNTICPGLMDELTLKAPGGFKEYYWYTADFSQLLGTQNTLTVNPLPPVNTKYALSIVPYPNLGCPDTVFTTIVSSDAVLELKVSQLPLKACSDVGVDITDPLITAGSTPGLRYTFHTDAAGKIFVQGTKAVRVSGTYYIKATAASGCYIIKPVSVIISEPPVLVIHDPPAVCKPQTADITKALVTAGSSAGLTFSYWRDPGARIPLLSPDKVTQSGIYYIKASSALGCPVIRSISVIVDNIPELIVTNVAACVSADITQASVTAGSTPGLPFTYWMDAACIVSLAKPDNVTQTGTYYIKITNPSGCIKVAPVKVTIYPLVNFVIDKPVITVNYPETVDITTAITPNNGLKYSYWRDSLATKSIANPYVVSENGIFYIKADNSQCSRTLPVKVVIIAPPEPKIAVSNTFTPNSDGINDLFIINITGIIKINYFKIFDRWGQTIFSTRDVSRGWDGKKDGKDAATGTYYWVFDAYDDFYKRKVNGSGPVTLVR